MSDFLHLHNHSEYSMLDGACRISDMVDWAVENSAPAVALTDHGNMHGAWELYSTAKEKGVDPIIGCEVYVAPEDRKSRDKTQEGPYHLTLLAENAAGYQNLLKLSSLGYTEGFYSKPRIDMEILRAYNEGIIVLTGCIQGQIPQLLSSHQRNKALLNFRTLLDIMGERNVYVEVQNHYINKEYESYAIMTNLAKEFDLPIVGTNDCHYLRESDYSMHDILLCIQMKKTISDEQRMRFDNHLYFKSDDEMRDVLQFFPEEAISNTIEIGKRCANLELNFGESVMPKYDVPEGYTNDSYLRKLCTDGLQEKYGTLSTPIQERLDHELGVISQMGYSGYFLIVWDYVAYANKQGYPLSARGSAASSLVLYALRVITFNPMDYDCIFERFLNPERISPPDIDIDFSDRARDYVIEYLINKYGEESVGKVATFSTLGARAAIKDVGRALEIPADKIKSFTNLIPMTPNITLKETLDTIPEFQELAEQPENQNFIDLSCAVEGMKRHVSCHASAIVISNGPLTDYVPLFKDRNDQIATQFEGSVVEKVGIVKFDSLGVRSLTETYDCLQMVEKNYGIKLKLEDIPFDDKQTFQLLGKGLISGIFQLETSPGMKRVVTQIKPDNFEEFIAIPALYRPGPLESGMAQQYINRKNGIEKVEYPHPLLEDALKSTYGVCVYQEQVMQIARDLAGFTLAESDVLRSAISKKNESSLSKQETQFLEGAINKGLTREEAKKIFDLLEPFGRYGFNKSHTVAYSMLGYRMAYLKTHYPHEFMASMMTGESHDSNKITRYRSECKDLASFLDTEIKLLPPDVNSSYITFTVEDKSICFGLTAIKNLNENAITSIIEAREEEGPFRSVQDFCERVDLKMINKKAIENLIMSGSFDQLEGHRAQHLANLDNILKASQSIQNEKSKGQMSLFGATDPIPITKITLVDADEYSMIEKLKQEKEQLGFYVSGHPLEEHAELIENYTTISTDNIMTPVLESEAYIIGIISKVRKIKTRKGASMAGLIIEDLEGAIEVVVFPEVYKKSEELLSEGRAIWIKGKITTNNRSQNKNSDEEEEERQIQAEIIRPVENVKRSETSTLEIQVQNKDMKDEKKMTELQKIAKSNSGKNDLVLRLINPELGEVIIKCSDDYKMKFNPQIVKKLRSLFGENAINISNRTKRNQRTDYRETDFV